MVRRLLLYLYDFTALGLIVVGFALWIAGAASERTWSGVVGLGVVLSCGAMVARYLRRPANTQVRPRS
jgi:hypothetical protein